MASSQSSRASSPLSTLSHTPERGFGNDNIEVRGTTTAKRTIDALNAIGNDTGDAGNDDSNDNGGPAKRVRIENEIADPAGHSGSTEDHIETGPQTAPTSTAIDLENYHIAAQAASAASDNHIDSNHIDEIANDEQSVVDSITAANSVAQAAAPLSDQHHATLPSRPVDNSHGQNKIVASVIATGSGPEDKLLNISLPSRYSGSYRPTLWSDKRTGICETLEDYRAHQGSLYTFEKIARGVLLDKEAERLDILSAQVAIFSV